MPGTSTNLAAPTIFCTVTANTEFTAGMGLPGQALATGKPAWMGDLGDRGSFPRFQFAHRCGLKCGVAFPVLSGDEVVAVVEFYGTEARAPDPVMVELMVQAGTQLGRAIERQRAQDRLQAQTVELAAARDEAKDADRAKSAFLANMSHELRTPLNAIIGFSEMMLGGVYGPLNDKYAEYAGDIRSSGVHLKNILNDILDLSKIDAGAMQIYPRPVSLAETAEACRRIVTPMAEAGGVVLSIVIQDRMPLFELDPTRFQQALLNILSNAVKFTPRDGHVEVRARLERLECIISVIDTGIGMTAEGVQLALKPFRQVDSNLNRRFEGTGLGLPLAKALTELHGGRITIESEPEKGTIVQLHLPAELAVRAA
jgi:signal transduction histidine kinase